MSRRLPRIILTLHVFKRVVAHGSTRTLVNIFYEYIIVCYTTYFKISLTKIAY